MQAKLSRKNIVLKFNPEEPVLKHSAYERPPFGWVDGIRKKFPDIWDACDNEMAEDSFLVWKAHEDGHRSEATQKWVNLREKWAKIHHDDGLNLLKSKTSPTLAKQVIKMMKWGVVGKMGLDAMVSVISDLIDGNFKNESIVIEKTFSDYPESVLENVKKALAWKEGHADRKVDEIWSISEKIEKGLKLTIGDLKKIVSFEKHREYAGKSYDDVEPVLYDAVGGTNGIIWAKRILQSLNEYEANEIEGYKACSSNEKCRSCFSYVEGFCSHKSALVIPTHTCDDWAEYKDLGKGNHFSGESQKKNSVSNLFSKAAPDGLSVGDFVSWNSSGGQAQGKISRIVRNGEINVPDSSLTITGTPEDPAALITLYRDGEATDRKVGHKFSTLTKIAAPKSVDEYDEKHIVNIEETESSYIIEYGKSKEDLDTMDEEEEYVEAEKISVPSYISRNARRGLDLLEFAGDGLTDGTKREARAMASGSISDDKAVRMNAWFLRHRDDLNSDRANAYLRGESDRPTAGQVAWLLWGGDLAAGNRMRAQKWAEKQVARIERERESTSGYGSDDEEKGGYDEEKRSVVSFNLKGKKFFGKVDRVEKDAEIELLYESESGDYYNTGTKISLIDEDLEEVDYINAPERMAKHWNAQAPITDTKAFEEVRDSNGSVVDYKDVVFKGYASTNESVTKGDRIGDYLQRGAFKKTIGRFMKNPVMLIDHENSVKEIAGTYTKIYEDKNGLMVEGKISNSPDLRNVRFLVAEGHLKTLSIGGMFLYEEDGKGISEVNLYEISLVAIPMNPDALFSVRNVDEEFFFKKLQK